MPIFLQNLQDGQIAQVARSRWQYWGTVKLLLLGVLQLLLNCLTAAAQVREGAVKGVWNGYLAQINILECSYLGGHRAEFSLTVLGNTGEILSQTPWTMSAFGTAHLIINQLAEISDRYGLLVISGDEMSIDQLRCHTVFYRFADQGSAKKLAYAFAIPAGIALQGESAGVYNPMNPDPAAGPVANFLTIYNPGISDFSAQVLVYRQDGSFDEQQSVNINNLHPGERRDYPLGLRNGEVMGQYRIVPQDSTAPYGAFLSRYGKNRRGEYNFAFYLQAQLGIQAPEPLPASTMPGNTFNWAEILNPTSRPVDVLFALHNSLGELLTPAQYVISIPPFSQHHVFLNDYLGPVNIGQFQTQVRGEGRVIVQSLFYGRRIIDDPDIEWAYASQSKAQPTITTVRHYAFLNTYLGAYNWVKLLNATGTREIIDLNFVNGDGTTLLAQSRSILPAGSIDIGAHEVTGPDFAGLLQITPERSEALLKGELLRVFGHDQGGIGYIMNIPAVDLLADNDSGESSSSQSSGSSSSQSSSQTSSPNSSSSSSSSSSASSESSQNSSHCGNQVIDEGESCDCGPDFRCELGDPVRGDATCENLGFESGALRCSSDCAELVLDECVASNESIFVDGALSESCPGNYSIRERNCSGTDGTAFLHPQEAAEYTQPGDTIFVRSGRYLPHPRLSPYGNALWIRRTGRPGFPIRYLAYGTETAILDSDGRGAAVYIDGRARSTPDHQPGVSYIDVQGFEITSGVDRGSGGAGILVRQSGYTRLERNFIHHNGSMGILIIEQGGDDTDGQFNGDYGYHIVRQNIVLRNRGTGISSRGHHTLIEANYTFENVDPVAPGNSDGIAANGDYTIVKRNVMRRNSDDGGDFAGPGQPYEGLTRGPKFMLIEGNVAYENGEVDGLRGDGSGIKLGTHDPSIKIPAESCIVRNNTSFRNRLRGIEYSGDYRDHDTPAAPFLFYGNTIFDNGDNGLYIEEGRVILLNNISYNPNNGPFMDVRLAGPSRELYSDWNFWGVDRYIKDEPGNFLTNWDTHSLSGNPQFVNTDNVEVETDVLDAKFADVLGLRLNSNSLAIDAGVRIDDILREIQHQILNDNPHGYERELWLRTINFALDVVPDPYPYSGASPDLGAFELEQNRN